jgi:hypothetical protein
MLHVGAIGIEASLPQKSGYQARKKANERHTSAIIEGFNKVMLTPLIL